jgi:hypothetical protein
VPAPDFARAPAAPTPPPDEFNTYRPHAAGQWPLAGRYSGTFDGSHRVFLALDGAPSAATGIIWVENAGGGVTRSSLRGSWDAERKRLTLEDAGGGRDGGTWELELKQTEPTRFGGRLIGAKGDGASGTLTCNFSRYQR